MSSDPASISPSDQPVVYVDREELAGLLRAHDRAVAEGRAYEWEGEGVAHLRVHPARHAYGAVSGCLFLPEGTPEAPAPTPGADVRWIVRYGGTSEEPTASVARRASDGRFIPVAASFIPARSELHSRSRGILEVDALAGRCVAIVGLGSFGSQIAIELAKAGVGAFSLFDFDRVELHNLMRHTCVLQDLGRLKTDVLRDAILGKNPYAVVDLFPVDVNREEALLEAEVAKADLVICATDNNRSRFTLQGALLRQRKTCIFGRAVTRAEGGDVFRYRPGGPCYCCLIGNGWYSAHAEEITDEASARRDGRIAAYVSPEDAAAVVQVGLSADIAPICNLMEKLALVELSRGTSSPLAELDAELPHDYYMWANRRERHYGNWAPFPAAGQRPTILRWYGARIERDPACAYCAATPDTAGLDTGGDLEARLGDMGDVSDIRLDDEEGR